MAKNALFRRALFGFAKEDVNHYIAKQDQRVQELVSALGALEEKFETHRRFYETLMRVYQENLKVLREVQIRAAHNEETVHRLSSLFASLSAAYRELYELSAAQKEALSTAKLYESKATKYDELSRQMKELVLPESMRTVDHTPLLPLPQLADLPQASAVDALSAEADEALKEMLADAKAFSSACARLQNPAPPQAANGQNAG